jgi:hypothetical protein
MVLYLTEGRKPGEPFYSSRYSVEHAASRLDEFQREIVTFAKDNPYSHIVESDTQRGFQSHKIKLGKKFPPRCAGTIFDVANSLRSALDQAGRDVACGYGKTGNKAHFPFGDDKASATAHINGQSKDIPQEIFDHMIAFKPYKGGNNLLWGLNNLANTPKHESIIDIQVAPGLMMISGKIYPGIERVKFPRWDSGKHEMEISRTPLGSTDKVNFNGTLYITIGNVEGLAGKEVVSTLGEMRRVVEGCVLHLEERARHFGFIK